MPHETCYMCDAPATSREHVPPRCLFPEQKDLPDGVDLRRELITVPSCDAHNLCKSRDDEYLLYALSMNIPNNEIASGHFGSKVMRAIQRNPSVIAQFTQAHMRVLVEDTATGQVNETVALRVDFSRVKRALEMIGRALYFHHFKNVWRNKVSAHPHFILALTEPDAEKLNEPNEKMAALASAYFKDRPFLGENPDVFCYQVADSTSESPVIMLLRFYKGSQVTLVFKDDTSEVGAGGTAQGAT